MRQPVEFAGKPRPSRYRRDRDHWTPGLAAWTSTTSASTSRRCRGQWVHDLHAWDYYGRRIAPRARLRQGMEAEPDQIMPLSPRGSTKPGLSRSRPTKPRNSPDGESAGQAEPMRSARRSQLRSRHRPDPFRLLVAAIAAHAAVVCLQRSRGHLVHFLTSGQARSAEPALLGPCRPRRAARAAVTVSVRAH
jgi:hypothetical protein